MTNILRQPRFWQRPVQPARPVDLSSIPIFRRSAFAPDQGPGPWLDQPDAQARIEERLAAGEITAAEAQMCRKWSRDGYVILERFYSAALLDRTWKAYEDAIAAGNAAPPAEPVYEGDPLPGRLHNVHFFVRAMDRMLHEPRMNRVVGLLLGAKAMPFQTIVGHKASQQPAHSDAIHMTTYPCGYLAANWVAFEDIDALAGPLVFYPGSHKLPYVLSEDLGIPAGTGYERYVSDYEPAIQRAIAEHGLQPEHFLAKKGDVLLWHANLLHGGSRLQDPKRSRKALVCHFIADGVVCYQDLVGTLAHVHSGENLYRYRRFSARRFLKRALAAVRARS